MKKRVLITLFLLLASALPAAAESKSVAVRVSCIVAPQVEIGPSALSRGALLSPSFKKQFHMAEDFLLRDGKKTKLYSLTAL